MTIPPENVKAPVRAPNVVDVARLAGVSHQTVSRVLNNHPSLRDSTRQKVLEAMKQLNYRPNAAARALSSSRSRMIGILSTSSGEYGPSAIISAVEAAARDRGYSVTIANADGVDSAAVDAAVDHLANLSAEGLVVVAPQTQVLAALTGLDIHLPFVTAQTAENYREAALLDQVAGARSATSYLLGLGHTRIGHIAGPPDWLDASQRLAGFSDELSDHGLGPGIVASGDWTAASGYRAAMELLDQGVTAIFAGNDQMALGALSAVSTMGLRVPGDVSVVGFDDVPEAAYYSPALTTVRQDLREAGRQAVARLLGEVDAPLSLLPILIVRDSAAAPRP